MANPLPPGTLKALKVEVPNPPGPERFTKADWEWLERKVVRAVAAARNTSSGKTVLQFTDAEKTATYTTIAQMSVAVATRALEVDFLEVALGRVGDASAKR